MNKNIIAVLLIISISSFMLHNATATNTLQLTSPNHLAILDTFPISAKNGIIIAAISILLITAAVAIIYMLSTLINSYNSKAWAMSQIYEALLSLAMLLIFSSFMYLFLVSPQNTYGSVGLIPTHSCSTSSTIFELSVCDVTTFNNYAFSLSKISFVLLYLVGLSPGFKIQYQSISKLTKETTGGLVSTNLAVSTELPSLISKSGILPAEVFVTALIAAIALSNVQSIILAGSMLFLSFFIIVGLVSRTFGFSRSFGGVMIALGLGIGLVYPLIVTISYGFIVNNMYSGYITVIKGLPAMAVSLIGLAVSVISTHNTALSLISPAMFKAFGYTIAGLTIIPLMNFVILDTFIVDFSAAVGERINFMQLLSGFI